MELLGLSEERQQAVLDELEDELADVSVSAHGSRSLHQSCGFDRVSEALDELAAELEEELLSGYRHVQLVCGDRVAALKLESSAHCANCRHFCSGAQATGGRSEGSAACDHPKHGALLSVNKHFPFKGGCKLWIARNLPSKD